MIFHAVSKQLLQNMSRSASFIYEDAAKDGGLVDFMDVWGHFAASEWQYCCCLVCQRI